MATPPVHYWDEPSAAAPPPTPEEQAAADADLAALRDLLASALTPNTAYRIRGIAAMLEINPAALLNQLLTESQPALAVVEAAVAHVIRPGGDTVRRLILAVAQLHNLGGPKGLLADADMLDRYTDGGF